MKKILLFTGILFLVFSANLKAQTLDSVIVTSPMLCDGDDATVEAYVTQTSPSTSIQFRAYWFATSTFVTIFGSSDQTTGSQQPFTSNQCGDFIMLIVDSTLFAANAPTAPFQHSTFVQALSDPSILGSYNYTINCAPAQLSATTTSNTDNLCFGDCIAEEGLLISGGSMPYSFNINGGVMQTIATGNTQDFVALCAGTYNIEVIDSNACQTSPQITTFIISEPPVIIPNGSITSNFNGVHISCFGGSDGQITASATGGTGPFEYSIDGITFTSSSVFNGLSATTYTIYYRDANSCIATELFTLNAPPALSGLLSETQSVSCYGGCDGELTFSVDGTQIGTPPYQYSIDGLTFQNSEIFSGLCGNIAYDVIVEDANGCQYTASHFLSEPTAISYSTTITGYNGFEISCNGLNDGQITVNTPTGGVAPYQYSSDGGGTYGSNNIFPNLTAGQYTISVIDFNGCTTNTIINMNEPGVFTLTETIDNGINCPEVCSGAVSVIALNGITPVNYSLSGGASQTTTFWNNLCGDLSYGSYDIDAIDLNGCTATVNFSIPEPTPFVYTLDSVVESCLMSNGQAIINYVSGGTGSWSYLWDDALAQTTATAINLSAATYQVTVTDGNNCQFTEDVEVGSEAGFTLSFDSISPCLGGTEGSATVYTNGASGSPSYLWGNGETTQTINNLSVGTYSVDVTDATGCVISGSVEVIPDPNPLMIDSLIISPITCHDANNASIQVLATGGQQFNPDGIANNGDEYYLYSNNNGFSNQTSIGFANLSPNTYIIHIEDAKSCIDRDTVVIVNPDLIEIDSTIFTSISCYGVDDGAIQAINVIGGTPPFEYSVNGSTHYTNMAFFNGYGAGTYTVEAYDIYNCTAQDIIIIEEPDELDVTITTSGWVYNPNSNTYSYQIRCNGDSSGFANIAVNGGTTPYSITCLNSNGNTVASGPLISGLTADVYTFIVMDANGCTYSETITFNEPSPIVHNFIPTHVTCSGWSNGSLIDMISGGVGTATSYIYAWSTGDSTFSLTGIPIGTYIMTVIDDNNCISVDSFNINDNNALSASTTGTDVSCHDYCDGVITTTVTGGLPNYDINGNPVFSYQWNDVLLQNTANAIGLCVDNLTNTTDYSCLITDGQGCSVTVTQTITQAEELVVSASILNEISCYLGNDGRLTASATGGNGGNNYLWNNWSSWNGNPFNNNLTLGSYVVVAQDLNGCMDTTEITLSQPSEMTINISVSTHVLCYNDDNGIITANASGGTPIPGIPPEYDYTWSNAFNEQIDISTAINLAPGIYTVTATDNNGCAITSESVYITEPSDALTITVDSIDESCERDDGQATAFVSGGTLPYTYNWDNGGSSNPIINLSPNTTYVVEVTDSNGCTVSSSTWVNGVTNIFLPGNLSEIDTTICLGNSVFIDIEEKPTLTYRWVDGPFDGWQQADRWITPTEPENVYILEITDPDPNCVPYDVTVTVNVNHVPVNLSTDNSSHNYAEHAILSPDISIHTVGIANGSTVELFSDNNNCDSYNWTWIDGNSPTQSISINPEKSGWYFIDVESAGCLGFDSIYVIVSVIPFDAITPNGDDLNDVWEIFGIENYNSALVQIFNRWGSIIYETSGGDAYQAWDGTNNGEELPVGTYYYIIDLKTDDDPISGPITIIR